MSLTTRLAENLRRIRLNHGLSLEALSERSGLSRATLSRLENAEVSPTAEALGKLCAVYAMPMSRLMAMAEQTFEPLVARAAQAVWTDPATGYTRRVVSPKVPPLGAEVLECTLPPATEISYDGPPEPGLEHHLILQEGKLEVTVEGQRHELSAGDTLRFQLFGATTYRTRADSDARYLLVLI